MYVVQIDHAKETMNEPGTPVDVDAVRPLGQRRRVKRGIVASYIHDLSERHNGAHGPAQDAPAEAVEPSEEI
jgi:hypothetical protein